MANCLNCGHCKVKILLVPLGRKSRRWQHHNVYTRRLLNSRLQYGEVRCDADMWTTNNGSEFRYSSWDSMMRYPEAARLQFANKCMRYDP